MARKKQKGSSSSSSASSNSSPYAVAANLLTQVLEERKSFKKLVYAADGSLKVSKVAYAQVCQVLSYKSILDQVLDQVPKLKKDVHNTGLLYVLTYELLWGPNKSIKGGGVVKRKIMQHEQHLLKAIDSSTQIAQQLKELQTKKQQQAFPRYARVNTLLTSTKEVCNVLCKISKESKNDKATMEFYVDAHVPDLLVFPPSLVTDVMSKQGEKEDKDSNAALTRQQEAIRDMIQSGKLILQDKSSCFPAFCLVHGFQSSNKHKQQVNQLNYLDACAAPGNKTQHLASLVGSLVNSNKTVGKRRKHPTTTITALDRDSTRLAALSKRMQQLAPDNNGQHVQVVTREADFLEAKQDDFAAPLGSILLDPSCSGSGIYTAPDRWTEKTSSSESMEEEETKRIASLAGFQEKALRHAMSFESVSKIVYSTCSLHDRENEMVVQKALDAVNNTEDGESKSEQWRVVAPKNLQNWNRRGHRVDGMSDRDAACMIRASAEDETNGFFVCCLEKISGENNADDKDDNESTESLVVVPEGMAVYNGQFSSTNQGTVQSRAKQDVAPARGNKNPMKDSERSTSKKGPTGNVHSAPERKHEQSNANDKAASKKKAKKLAWKKRQMEQKQERLEQKKQKVSS
ncbi:Probable 28S rRNA (cytosine-C(5))-methyltransferase [Seminavis robusta]|uniref:Probable 28S rRNA (Cytosine-C(5))-methyltransferase n=1 Tax=Seminavis robusta TaxID=568900 RepID=A0A9N8DHV4_9STRA|nr:Probable 28S rRNA (cytosine-C(5))-methyltransferase [Seminavis robusta]|eukprot:Sro135_g063850.1 Probable 28S rRNA (cytosine-C(5))-methyltransferase (629) ;mRNA; f:71222-73108